MAAAGGGGVSIPVTVQNGQATQQINKLQQQLGKMGAAAKGLFGGQTAQQAQQYNRHLQNLERNLERVTMRVKTLQGAQSQLIQQQRQLTSLQQQDRTHPVNKALAQNQRSLSFWQARQIGANAQLGYAQGNRPAVGGGGGGIAQFLAGQFQSFAGGVGGALMKVIGITEVAKGAAAIASKVFLTAADEQKLLADLLPKMRLGDSLANASPKGYMNNLRDMSMPLGYSGVEALKIAQAMSPGSNNSGLFKDTHTAMQMGRMFGIDAGGQASMLAEGGKLGAFRPGDARRFAEMLAREISVTGLGPRAQEVQEATLTLLQRQVAMSGTASPAATMALQTVLAKTGIPGLQGQLGANVIGQMAGHFGGASDDPSVAFQEAMLRDQRGVRGYYQVRRAKEMISAGKDPRFLGDAIQEAYQLTPHEDAAKDLLSRQLGIPMILLDEMGRSTRGGLRNVSSKRFLSTMRSFKAGGNLLGPGSKAAMTLPGNQLREAEATVSGTMGRMGTPLVQMAASLGQKASEQIQNLMKILDSDKASQGHLSKIEDHAARIVQKLDGSFPTNASTKQRNDFIKKYGMKPEDAHYDLHGNPVTPDGTPLTPGGTSGGTPALRRQKGGPPVLPAPPGIQPYHPNMNGGMIRRGSAEGAMHLHVHFDEHGAIHPHVKLAFVNMVEEALSEVQRRQVKGDTHLRYPRA